jgi:hypothetical protein
MRLGHVDARHACHMRLKLPKPCPTDDVGADTVLQPPLMNATKCGQFFFVHGHNDLAQITYPIPSRSQHASIARLPSRQLVARNVPGL